MKTAYVFPGQGSQSLGMLSDLAQEFPQVLTTFEEASEALGFNLWKLCQDGPESELNRTELTQPALLTASTAIWRLLQNLSSIRPDFVAGHSLGEYSALVAAEVLSLKDAVALVHLRGKLMQSAVPAGRGAMAAVIGLDDQLVIQGCREAAQGAVVEAVNFNAPGQVVIAGESEAVERAAQQCKALGARRVLPLPVSVPSHCALMKDPARQLSQELERIAMQGPAIPVLQNVDAKIQDDLLHVRQNLVKQLYSPVLWTQSMERLAGHGVGRVVECGPGKVLTGLVKRCLPDAQVFSTPTVGDLRATLESMSGGVK